MAIAWDVSITNVDVAQNRADISFTRTDDVTLAVENYTFKKTIIETSEQRAALLNTVWGKHGEVATKQAAVDAFITDLEQAGKANLEAREA